MTATSIFFNGKRINQPGAYSKVDAEGLATIQLGASGIIAVLAEANGSKPNTIHTVTTPAAAKALWRDGDMKDVIDFLFLPSNDPDIPGGAQELRMIAVNPSTQSSGTFNDGSGTGSMTLTSVGYGLYTTALSVAIAAGTNKGKLITLVLEDTTESFDDVGGDSVFSLLYTPGTNGATTMTGQVRDAGSGARSVRAQFTKAFLGEDNLLDATHFPTDEVTVVSSDAADTSIAVTVYGTDATDAPVSETITTNATDGTTPVTGVQAFKLITGVQLASAMAGVLTVQDQQGAPNVSFTVPIGTLEEGLVTCANMPVENATVSFAADGATTKTLTVYGLDTSGQSQSETVVLNGAASVPTTATWSEITAVFVAQVEVARTVTVSGTAVDCTTALGQDTLKKVVDKYNQKGGFTAVDLLGRGSAFDIEDLDLATSAVSLLTTAKIFYADNFLIVEYINANSSIVTAAAASGWEGEAANTVSPVFLTGGVDGVTQFSNWQTALSLLRTERVNTVVPLTTDTSIHTAVKDHCVLAASTDKSERDCKLGMAVGTTKTAWKAQAVALNSRHCSLYAQEVQRVNSNTGLKEWFPPYFQAALAAGMQAGGGVGLPLTHKYANVLDVRNSSTWDAKLDVSELLDAGVCFMEEVQGVGHRWVRGLTTHLTDSNLAYIEQSVNQAVDYSIYNLRTALEDFVGSKGFAGTVSATKAKAASLLDELVDLSIVSWQNLTVTLVNDVLTVDVEIAPVIGVNFIPITAHLVGTQLEAA